MDWTLCLTGLMDEAVTRLGVFYFSLCGIESIPVGV